MTITNLEIYYSELHEQKADYYADNGNRVDEHIMYLVGKMEGIKAAIEIMKGQR